MQSQKRQNDLCSFPRQTIQYHGNPNLSPTSNAEEAEVKWFYEDLQDLLELTTPPPKKKRERWGWIPYIVGNCKNYKGIQSFMETLWFLIIKGLKSEN